MEMTLGRIIEIPQAWLPKEEAIIFFGYKGHEASFQKLLAEFKDHPEFGKGYRSPTYKIVTVHIQRFDDFLTWKQANKFKTKETRAN